MSVWESITGQASAVAQLRAAIARGRVPHSYLFSGPAGAPLVEAALALAAARNCHVAPGEGCDVCDSCAKIATGIHPDVVTLVREGAAQIVPIESVRTQVLGRVGIPPHEADVRVFIVEEATAMAPPAANALLKTLEEPPPQTSFVLCTTAPEQLLPTIRSRCQRVRFGGGTIAGGDPARMSRLAALAEELAGDRHDLTLAARIAEGKGDTPQVLVAAAQRLHARAHEAAQSDVAWSRRAAARAHAILSWHTAVAIHNASPQLAIEALIVQLGRLDHAEAP